MVNNVLEKWRKSRIVSFVLFFLKVPYYTTLLYHPRYQWSSCLKLYRSLGNSRFRTLERVSEGGKDTWLLWNVVARTLCVVTKG